MGNAAESLYQLLANRGEAGRDFSLMIEMLEGK
jgi:3-hydroxyisobutyrate dehydrogenase